MNASNPPEDRETSPLLSYATPAPLGRAGSWFREGNVLVVGDGSELPERCIFCGEGKTRDVLLTFTWDPSFQVTRQKVTLELRRSGTVRAHMCTRHYRGWSLGRMIGMGGMIVSALLMVGGVTLAVVSESSDVPLWTGMGIGGLLAGFGMMILFLFVFTLRTRTMSCRRIAGGLLFLAGAGEEFLKGLPPLPQELKE
jgi:hypothetical protein